MANEKQPPEQTVSGVQPVAPGTVVSPGGSPSLPPAPVVTPVPAAPQPAPQQQAAAPAAPTPAPQMPQPIAQQPNGPSRVEPDNDDPEAVSWVASEFVAHDKSAEWYVLLAIGTIVGSALMYLLTRDYVSVGVVVMAALIFGIYGSHKPRQIQYRISRFGISVGNKNYSFEEFKSFTVWPEGAFSSIVLMPLKRFAVPISIYYAPNDEELIVDILAEMLPYEQRRRDAVDSLMRKVRF